MDQIQLQQKIALYYGKLPTNSQQLFSSMVWMETLQSICTKYNLNDLQKETLGTETTLVLLGIIHLEEYEGTLINKLGLSRDLADKLVKEIDDFILKSIRPELEEVFEKNVQSLLEEKYGDMEKLDERFNKLPAEIQEAITESNYQAKLYNIAEKAKLSIDQMGNLEEVTNKVLLGIIHPDKYESELKAKLGLSEDKISEIVNEVNEGILKNIREILKKHSEGNIEGEDADDEIPIPPYALVKTIKPIEKITEAKPQIPEMPIKNESAIYQNAGIEMIDDKKTDDISGDIIKRKLGGTTVSDTVTSEHSLPKIAGTPMNSQTNIPQASKSNSHDPYHEPI